MPVFLDNSNKRKLYFRAAVLGIFMLALLAGTLFLFGFSLSASNRKEVSYQDAAERYHYYYTAANNKKIALTIDDGPNPMAADTMMEALTAYQAPATFFYIGEKVLRYPNIAREAASRGFDVESHSFTHGQGVHGSYNRMAFELSAAGYVITQMTSTEPLLYRPPFLLGIGIDPTVNPYIDLPKDVEWALQLGYLPVGSDIDPRDWLATSPEDVVKNFKTALDQNIHHGHIVLLHEDVNTAKAMPEILAYIRESGYKIVPLQELITPPTNIALPATLSPGDTDERTGGAISNLQWFLYKENYLDAYGITGVFGQQTASALENFQIDRGLINPHAPDKARMGVADAATRALITRVSAQETPQSEAPPATLWSRASNGLGASMRGVYVEVFPVVRITLMVVTYIALFLVLVRALALITLIIMKRYAAAPPPLPRRGRTMPGISVLIPAYNEQENIAATVESIASNLYPKREIIVIDDGSKDSTASEVERVMRRCPKENIQLIKVENGGKARALNIGLERAKHEIIVVLDADAVLDRGALYYFARHFADPSVGAVAGKVCTTRRAGLLDLFQTLEYAVGQNIDKRAFSTIGGVGIVPGPAGAWRRSCLDTAGGFSSETLVEDQDMTLTLLRQGKKIIYEPRVVAYTETPGNLRNFLKQRFRWVYGTMQCFWKHKGALRQNPKSVMSLVVLPNVFIYNIFLPFTYPFADSALLFGIIFGEWKTLVLPFALFTLFDLAYALYGIWGEQGRTKLMLAVPLQRIVYRQLLYITVVRGIVRAVEGTGSGWNKFTKMGETRRFYFSNISTPDEPTLVLPSIEPLSLSRYGELVPEAASLAPTVLTNSIAESEAYASQSQMSKIQ